VCVCVRVFVCVIEYAEAAVRSLVLPWQIKDCEILHFINCCSDAERYLKHDKYCAFRTCTQEICTWRAARPTPPAPAGSKSTSPRWMPVAHPRTASTVARIVGQLAPSCKPESVLWSRCRLCCQKN